MKKSRKVIMGAALVGGLMLTGIGTANAGLSYVNFSATMPNLQQAWDSAAQTKASSGAGGNVSIATVGSNYAANARMCYVGNDNNCGTEIKALKGGDSGVLSSGFKAGNKVDLQLHETPYAVVSVSATGKWRSN